LRIWAVLQRIALCYFAVSVIALTVNHKHLIKIIVGLLVLYSAILLLGHGYDYDSTTNILAQIDLRLFGYDHLYHKSPVDPEGLMGTIPSIAHTLIGFYCAKLMMSTNQMQMKILHFLLVGGVLVIGGYLLSYILPLNKRIWSPSYVMVTCGLAALLQGIIINGEWRTKDKTSAGVNSTLSKKSIFFVVFGVNPLFLYVMSELMAIVFSRTGIGEAIYQGICMVVSHPPQIQSLIYALLFTLLHFVIGWVLYKRHIYIKL
jgi:predicted acyltransferase